MQESKWSRRKGWGRREANGVYRTQEGPPPVYRSVQIAEARQAASWGGAASSLLPRQRRPHTFVAAHGVGPTWA